MQLPVIDDFGKRKHLFEAGKHYRVLRDTKSATWRFTEGEVLQFLSSSYSRYDCSWVFEFTAPDGEKRSWFLGDDDPLESASQVFTARDEKA